MDNFKVEHSSALLDYIKKHILATILILIVLLSFSGLIIVNYRSEMREMRKEMAEKTNQNAKEMKGELLDINDAEG